MTDREINIAIAKVCGWRKIDSYTSIQDGSEVFWWRLGNDEATDCVTRNLPDYCHDLNAMHEVWKTTIMPRASENLQTRWRYWLQSICRRDTDIYGFCSVSNATARQRAEAFLRTLGKWSDSSDDKYALAAAKCL